MGLQIIRVSWDLWKPSACNHWLQAKLLLRSWSSETTAYASSSLLSLVLLDVIDATSNCSFQFNLYTAHRGPDFDTIDKKSKSFNETRVAAFTAFQQFTKKVTKSTFSKEHIAEKHQWIAELTSESGSWVKRNFKLSEDVLTLFVIFFPSPSSCGTVDALQHVQ